VSRVRSGGGCLNEVSRPWSAARDRLGSLRQDTSERQRRTGPLSDCSSADSTGSRLRALQGLDHVVQFLWHDRDQDLAFGRFAFHNPGFRVETIASRSEGERSPVRRRPAGRAASSLPKEGFQARGSAPPIRRRPALQRES
jgi:hypothetical protein